MASNESTPPPSQLPRGLLSRRGVPAGKAARLPSIRGTRDLTLGGVPKKSFVPTIPARRNKTELQGDMQDGRQEAERRKTQQPDRGKRGGRGRGRGRGDVIQSHSIFEQGPTDRMKPKYGFGGSADRVTREVESKPKIKREKREDQETKKILDDLLNDDFIDDLPSGDPNMIPVKLPLAAAAIKSEVKTEIKPAIKIKTEPKDEVDGSESSVKMEESADITGTSFTSQDQRPKSLVELLTTPSDSEYGDFIFFQLPDVLPGDPPLPDDDVRPSTSRSKGVKVKEEPGAEQKTESGETQDELSKKLGLCALHDFSEGHIGKLKVHKSGKTTLVLGNTTMEVTMGTPIGFLQDLVSIRVEDDSGSMTVLEHVNHKAVCIPDFDAMLTDR